ncbi:MAG: amidohydrolase family protein, partial [Pseudomonadales bacterium]|nr:amidohydrolase family protein [Pseudomonadales bacterium]
AAFCPSSNLFLGSGLFPLLAIRDKGIPIAIGTDVGAGTSLSMISTLGDAYRVCQLQSFSLDPLEAFYMVTMGNARVLHLDDRIGNFCAGKEADFVLLNPSRNPQVASRVNTCQQIRDELFCYMILGDERLIEQTSVSGHIQFQQEPI